MGITKKRNVKNKEQFIRVKGIKGENLQLAMPLKGQLPQLENAYRE